MAKTAVVTTRMDPDLKRDAEQVFRELGLTTTQAITLFYRQVELQRGLPLLEDQRNVEHEVYRILADPEQA